ncbi:MAG TPA: hypothetical protein VK151_04020 [Fluviicola sp.]|nr:hypothetical protein [Fluviicola sp.]
MKTILLFILLFCSSYGYSQQDTIQKRQRSVGCAGSFFKPNGYNKIYNECGELWQDGIFKESKLYDGKVYIYDRDCILYKVKIFKEGLYHSDELPNPAN